jgi:GNAT superfamily N-acetyltransferase
MAVSKTQRSASLKSKSKNKNTAESSCDGKGGCGGSGQCASKSDKSAKTSHATHASDNDHDHGHGEGGCCGQGHGAVCELSLRRFVESDYKGLLGVWKSGEIALDDTDTLKAITKNLKDRPNAYRIFVAEAQMVDSQTQKKEGKSRIAGGAIVTFDGHRMYVYHLAVHVDFRSVGLGAALLEMCEMQAKNWGAKHLRLTSRTDASRKPARAMYESRGWDADKTICIYRKTLK